MLGKYDVAYHECRKCESLQTDTPYWLVEAYSESHLGSADTGAVARCLSNQSLVFTLARVLRLSRTARILDFGGGNGLLCRLLRDIDFDARRFDSHAVNDFAQNFDDDGGTYDLVCAFEVVEHFANPAEELPSVFEWAQRAVMIGTESYAKQGRDWWYLNPAGGQHVFFYSHGAMRHIATLFGFSQYFLGGLHLFSKSPLTKTEQFFLARALSRRFQKWVRAYLGFRLSFDSAGRDSGLF